MKIKSRLTMLLVVVAALAFIPMLYTGHAQAAANQIEYTGVVQAASSASLTVDALVVDITNAQIKSLPVVGAIVKVEGTLNADGSITAREVALVTKTVQLGAAEITGVVADLTTTQITVAGLSIDISKAEIGTGVVVGAVVKVHATLTTGGTWSATEVRVAEFGTPEGTMRATMRATDDSPENERENERKNMTSTPKPDDKGGSSNSGDNKGGDDKGGGDRGGRGGDDKGGN